MYIVTCVSVRRSVRAKLSLSQTDKYLVVLNLFSNATNCSYVKAVLALLGFPALLSFDNFFFLLPLEDTLFTLKLFPRLSLADPLDEQFELDPIALLKMTLSLDEVIGDSPLESGSTKLHVKS